MQNDKELLEPRAETKPEKIHLGKEFYRRACRAKNPLNPKTATLVQLLTVLLGDESAAVGIASGCDGDLINLKNRNPRTFQNLPKVGPGVAGRLIAVFEMMRRANECEYVEPEFDSLALLKADTREKGKSKL